MGIIAIMILLPIKVFFLTKWMNKNYNWLDENDPRQKEKNILIKAFWIIAISMFAILGAILIAGIGENGTNIAVTAIQVGTFLVKFFFMAFVYIWVRWTLLRIRYDQLQMLGWKVLIPLSILNIVITAIFVVAMGS